jgi:hypothetical protein
MQPLEASDAKHGLRHGKLTDTRLDRNHFRTIFSHGDNGVIMACPDEDRIFLGSTLPDGSIAVVHHTADHKWHPGVVRKLEDGKPLHGGDIVQLEHVEGNEYRPVFLYRSKGKVNRRSYNAGYDNVDWGKN